MILVRYIYAYFWCRQSSRCEISYVIASGKLIAIWLHTSISIYSIEIGVVHDFISNILSRQIFIRSRSLLIKVKKIIHRIAIYLKISAKLVKRAGESKRMSICNPLEEIWIEKLMPDSKYSHKNWLACKEIENGATSPPPHLEVRR